MASFSQVIHRISEGGRPLAPRFSPVLKNLLRAVVVLRLESRELYLDPGPILLNWLRRPAIHMPLETIRQARAAAGERAATLIRRLDEVYPF